MCSFPAAMSPTPESVGTKKQHFFVCFPNSQMLPTYYRTFRLPSPPLTPNTQHPTDKEDAGCQVVCQRRRARRPVRTLNILPVPDALRLRRGVGTYWSPLRRVLGGPLGRALGREGPLTTLTAKGVFVAAEAATDRIGYRRAGSSRFIQVRLGSSGFVQVCLQRKTPQGGAASTTS